MVYIKISRAILEYLKKNEVKYIFGIPAGTVSGIYDELCDIDIKTIVTKNEAGAAYSATKYASITSKLGVCIVAGGVGVNNTINGIADSMRCQAPVLLISGHVQRWQMGKGAIQELETENILKPITKYSKMILKEEDVLDALKEAMEIALTPPRGPVHISIPVDMQVLEFKKEMPEKIEKIEFIEPYDNKEKLDRTIEIINRESNGIIMIGRGCRGLTKEVMELSTKLQWPIITTPQAKGIVSTEFELNLGNYGFSSTDAANAYVEKSQASCVLVLGSSLGESATKNYNEVIVKDRKLIHIDWNEDTLDRVFKADVKICMDLKKAIPKIINNINESKQIFTKPTEINKPYVKNHTGLSARLFFEKIPELLPKDTYYISDIGEYMNFVFKFMPMSYEADLDISLNYGAMGIGIGGAVGVKLANPDKLVAVFVGDGSFFMNGSEILVAKENKLPIVYFVINNSMLGYVQNGQSYVYGRALKEYKQERVSIADMTNSLGIKAMQLSDMDELYKIGGFIENLQGPCVVELVTDGSEPIPVADRFKELEERI